MQPQEGFKKGGDMYVFTLTCPGCSFESGLCRGKPEQEEQQIAQSLGGSRRWQEIARCEPGSVLEEVLQISTDGLDGAIAEREESSINPQGLMVGSMVVPCGDIDPWKRGWW